MRGCLSFYRCWQSLLSWRQNEIGHRQQERKVRTNQRVENIIGTKHENKIGLNKGKTKGGKERRRKRLRVSVGGQGGELKRVRA